MNCLRYIVGADPIEVLSATPDLMPTQDGSPSKVDAGMTATFAFPGDVTGAAICHLRTSPTFGFIPQFPRVQLSIKCENGELEMLNHVMPVLYHWIEVSVKDGKGGNGRKKRVEKVYNSTEPDVKGEDWWTT